ncbi:MAG: arginase family protein [Pseudoramibacter sp.]
MLARVSPGLGQGLRRRGQEPSAEGTQNFKEIRRFFILILNLSGVYRHQSFYGKDDQWIDLEDIPGTTGYCDDQAARTIRKRLKDCTPAGVHFIDNGNYHYLTYYWLEKLKTPVNLLVFDHHSDMLPPVFGRIMSCGSWLLRTVEELPRVKRVLHFGMDPDYLSHIPKAYRERVTATDDENRAIAFLRQHRNFPLYVSLDKDVFSNREVRTNWDQGELRFPVFARLMRAADRLCPIAGLDVCGESTVYGEQWRGSQFNRRLVRLIQTLNFTKKESHTSLSYAG